MVFSPKFIVQSDNRFLFKGEVSAVANTCLNKKIFYEFWEGFSFGQSKLNLSVKNEYIFQIGSTQKSPLDGHAYSINIDSDGVCVFAENEQDLIHGFITLIDRIRATEIDDCFMLEIGCCQIKDYPDIKTRMVNFCIFAETELWELQRFVRLCGALKYTHILLEFVGMIKLDCMKELAWPHAFTKEQIIPIIREANDLGIEIVPTFTHWGHASGGRAMHGKHVALDQNPLLQTYFSDEGWRWDISKPKVRNLLRQIRNEMTELCGEGSYFHIGCDEAYGFTYTKENMDSICDYINEINEELKAQNRRTIMWGDMFLYRYEHYNPKNGYACNAPTPEGAQYMLSRLSRDIVIADWQYGCKEAPVETTAIFKEANFDCLLCPYDTGTEKLKSVITTAKEQNLMGIIHTTWHTLSKGMPFVTFAALGGLEDITNVDFKTVRAYTGVLIRKVMPCGGDYEKSGWSKFDVSYLW